MIKSTTLNADASDMFIAALRARITDKKTANVASVVNKGGDNMAGFIRDVLALVDTGTVIWNAYFMVSERYDASRRNILALHDYNIANMSPETKADLDSNPSSLVITKSLQQFMNSCTWSERRALRDATLSEKEIGEIDFETGEMDIPAASDPHFGADQRLGKLVTILTKLQSYMFTSQTIELFPIAMFAIDKNEKVGEEWKSWRVASASTFPDCLELMTESMAEMRAQDSAKKMESAATVDFTNDLDLAA